MLELAEDGERDLVRLRNSASAEIATSTD